MGRKKNKVMFTPRGYEAEMPKTVNGNEYSEEEIDLAKSMVVEEEGKKISRLQKVSAIWTVLSTAYAIATTCVSIARGWVDHTLTYVLIALLAVYVVFFIVFVALIFKDPKKGKFGLKTYKKLLKIFKIIVNISFLSLTAVSMAGISSSDMSVWQWIVFVASFVVAAVQLGLNVWLLIFKLARRRIAKYYKVKITRFVDGKRRKKNVADTIEEKTYK